MHLHIQKFSAIQEPGLIQLAGNLHLLTIQHHTVKVEASCFPCRAFNRNRSLKDRDAVTNHLTKTVLVSLPNGDSWQDRKSRCICKTWGEVCLKQESARSSGSLPLKTSVSRIHQPSVDENQQISKYFLRSFCSPTCIVVPSKNQLSTVLYKQQQDLYLKKKKKVLCEINWTYQWLSKLTITTLFNGNCRTRSREMLHLASL